MHKAERLHALDAVRAFALLLGVIHHATLSFLPLAGLAPVEDVSTGEPLGLLAFTGHIFRMPLFFFMAGLFAHKMLHRRGVRGFVVDRVQRILVPLVAAWIVFFPFVNAMWSWGLTGSLYHSPLLTWPPSLTTFPTSYLWFLYYLLLIYALALIVRQAALTTGVRLDAADALTRRLIAARWLAPLALTLPVVFVALLRRSQWSVESGIETPNASMIPHLLPLFAYGLAFVLGWMIGRNMELLALLRERWAGYLSVALLATALCLLSLASGHAGNGRVLLGLHASAYAFACWCWLFAIVGLALRFLSTFSPVRRYVADASYWTYLLHYPIVLVLQDALARVPLHWIVKYPLILVITLTICLATYQLFVRSTIIGQVLNGRRVARPSTLPPHALQT